MKEANDHLLESSPLLPLIWWKVTMAGIVRMTEYKITKKSTIPFLLVKHLTSYFLIKVHFLCGAWSCHKASPRISILDKLQGVIAVFTSILKYSWYLFIVFLYNHTLFRSLKDVEKKIHHLKGKISNVRHTRTGAFNVVQSLAT